MNTGSSVFSAVREQLNIKDIAKYYGLEVNRGGFISCLFHAEKTPSMKVYNDHFHCFGCGKHGDVTDLTAQIFNLSPLDAAKKLAADFGVWYDGKDRYNSERKPTIKEQMTYYSVVARERQAFRILNDYCNFLAVCRKEYAPKTPKDEWHPLFIQSLQNLSTLEYYRDILTFGSKEEKLDFINSSGDFLKDIQQKLKTIKIASQAVEMA
jgi:flavodoxin